MWVKLYSNLLNWEWYSDINTTRLFIHCLLKASFKDKEWRGIIIKRGSFVTSLPKLSKETGLSIQQIRSSLDKLVSTDNITNKSYTKFRVITIKNYIKYQFNNSQTNRQATDKLTVKQQINQQTNNRQNTIKNNGKINFDNTQTTDKLFKSQQTNQHQHQNNRITEYQNNIYFFLEESFGRTITQIEMRKLDDWQKWFNDDVIKYAIELTLMRGARGLSYTEGIINSWHDKGFKTLEQCKNENKKELKINQEAVKRIQELEDYDWLND